MRIALISFCGKDDSKASAIIREIVKSAREAGGDIELFDGFLDEGHARFVLFDYIAIAAKKKGLFGGHLPSRVSEFFDGVATVAGKKGAAIIVQSGPFGNGKACANLMHVMEKQGILLDYFDIIGGADAARACGEKLG